MLLQPSPGSTVDGSDWLVRVRRGTISSIGSFLLALLLGAVVFLALGANPVSSYQAILSGALGGGGSLGETLNIWTPFVLTGLAALIPFRAGLWNAGGDGQLYAGAVGGILIGLTFTTLPGPLLALVIVLGAAAAGSLWALIPAVLKISTGASEIIVTLLLNFTAVLLADYVITGPWAEGFSATTRQIPSSAQVGSWVPGTNVGVGEVTALICALGVFLLIQRTRFGFALKMFGSNRGAAQLAGLSLARTTLAAFGIGGALAGLSGGILIVSIHHALVTGMSNNYGFIGIAATLLAGLNPLWLLPAAFLFSVLTVGSNNLTATVGIDPSAGLIVEAVFVVLLMALGVLRLRLWQGGTQSL